MSESDLATSSPPPPSPLFRPPLPPPLTPSTLCEVSWRWWWAVVVSRLVTMVVSSFYLVVAIVSLVLQHHRHVCVCMCACACVVLLVSSLYQRGAQHPSPLVTELLCCPRRRTRRLIWVMTRKKQGMPRMAGGDERWVLFRGAASPAFSRHRRSESSRSPRSPVASPRKGGEILRGLPPSLSCALTQCAAKCAHTVLDRRGRWRGRPWA